MSVKNIDIIKIVVSNKFSFGKKKINILLATKMLKNLYLQNISPKIECIWKRLCLTRYISFLIKDDELLKKKYNEIWVKVKNSLKKNLILNQNTKKNI